MTLINSGREAEDAARFYRQRYAEVGDDLLIWKLPNFELGQEKVDDLIGKIGSASP